MRGDAVRAHASVRLEPSQYAERVYTAWGLALQRFSEIFLGRVRGEVLATYFVLAAVGGMW